MPNIAVKNKTNLAMGTNLNFRKNFQKEFGRMTKSLPLDLS
jgi:hypothetical protein